MRILFVSERNCCRSQLSEGLVELIGREGTEAWSAGLMPGSELDPVAIEIMQDIGLDISGYRPKGLDDLPEVEFDVVVAINWPEDEVLVKARMRLDWDIPECDGLSRRDMLTTRNLLRDKIERLLSAPLPA